MFMPGRRKDECIEERDLLFEIDLNPAVFYVKIKAEEQGRKKNDRR
jgi:hypothetical protein